MNYKPGQMVRFIIARREHAKKYVGCPCTIVEVGEVHGYDYGPFGRLDINIEPGDLAIRHIDGHIGVVMAWQVEPIVDDGDLVVEEEREMVDA